MRSLLRDPAWAGRRPFAPRRRGCEPLKRRCRQLARVPPAPTATKKGPATHSRRTVPGSAANACMTTRILYNGGTPEARAWGAGRQNGTLGGTGTVIFYGHERAAEGLGPSHLPHNFFA